MTPPPINLGRLNGQHVNLRITPAGREYLTARQQRIDAVTWRNPFGQLPKTEAEI